MEEVTSGAQDTGICKRGLCVCKTVPINKMPHKISPMYTDGATVGITNFNTQGTKSWAFHYAQNSIKCSLEKNEFITIMAFKGKIFLPKNEALKHIILPLHTFFL